VTDDIRVLVVEDEPLIADAHGKYVERIPGFCLAGIAHSGQEALRLLKLAPADLILLDFNLPDLHGLELCRALRGAGVQIDVIAVTSTRDLGAVRSAVSLGVVQYLLKPFTFRSMQDKLHNYREYRLQMAAADGGASQSEIDRAFASLRGVSAGGTLPTGLSDETLETIARALQDGQALSAVEAAGICHVSRVTARRYLEHLTEAGVLLRRQRHGGSGRPEFEYSWAKHLQQGSR
jgi:response regulator of citrate/malate metabolism